MTPAVDRSYPKNDRDLGPDRYEKFHAGSAARCGPAVYHYCPALVRPVLPGGCCVVSSVKPLEVERWGRTTEVPAGSPVGPCRSLWTVGRWLSLF